MTPPACVCLCVSVPADASASPTSSSSGTDRVDFKFYDLLEQILDKQPSTSAAAAAAVSESIEISEDSDCEVTSETSKGSDAVVYTVDQNKPRQ